MRGTVCCHAGRWVCAPSRGQGLPIAWRHHVSSVPCRHAPNMDSVRWLSSDIWESLRQQVPQGTELHVFGAYVSGAAQQLHDPVRGAALPLQYLREPGETGPVRQQGSTCLTHAVPSSCMTQRGEHPSPCSIWESLKKASPSAPDISCTCVVAVLPSNCLTPWGRHAALHGASCRLQGGSCSNGFQACCCGPAFDAFQMSRSV